MTASQDISSADEHGIVEIVGLTQIDQCRSINAWGD
jgi:hypothetical protein